jgi:hypothetical protein
MLVLCVGFCFQVTDTAHSQYAGHIDPCVSKNEWCQLLAKHEGIQAVATAMTAEAIVDTTQQSAASELKRKRSSNSYWDMEGNNKGSISKSESNIYKDDHSNGWVDDGKQQQKHCNTTQQTTREGDQVSNSKGKIEGGCGKGDCVWDKDKGDASGSNDDNQPTRNTAQKSTSSNSRGRALARRATMAAMAMEMVMAMARMTAMAAATDEARAVAMAREGKGEGVVMPAATQRVLALLAVVA